MRRYRFEWLTCGALLLLLPALAGAQSSTTGAIAGVAKDPTGAVLPGVTIEVASPVLIEKFRTAVTDGEGQYRIVDLRPGTYSVTFTLPGFSTFKREGIVLTTGFTAAVSAEMAVGAVEQTITVSGAAPIVDIQNTNAQTVLSATTRDALPTGRSFAAFAALTLGAKASADVGGNTGEGGSIQIHNSRANDGKLTIDGMDYNHTDGQIGGGLRAYYTNANAMQEVTLTTGSAGAEYETGGVNVNFVPKDGGNTFHFTSLDNFTNHSLESSNLDAGLIARRATTAPTVKEIHDVGAGVGGPIIKDRLWFYSAFRHWHAQVYQPGSYWNLNQQPASLFYTPDLSRRGFTNNGGWDVSQRLTAQVGLKQKFEFYGARQNSLSFQGGSASSAPEATTYSDYRPNWIVQGSWTYPSTNRLLFEAGATYIANNLNVLPIDYFNRSHIGVITPDTIPITDTGLGITYGNSLNWRRKHAPNANARFSMSFVTGAHAFKTGFVAQKAASSINIFAPDISYTFKNQVPISLTEYALPRPDELRATLLALYSQDQWTMKKLTLSYGVRFDYLNGYSEAVTLPGGRFLAASVLPPSSNLPNFKDIDPRLGVAYDVFGNGKTAIKAAIGRYLVGHGVDYAITADPSGALAPQATRSWKDNTFGPSDPRTGNFIPDCDLTNPVANGECGPVDNTKIGTLNPTVSYAPNASVGWGVRDYGWQTQVSLQQQLRPGMAVNVAYFHTTFGNLTVAKNSLTTLADYSPYCVTTPIDARLPGGGGQQLCGLYDISPTLFGKVSNVITQASNYGTRTEVFNGFDIAITARFGHGGQINGGVSIGNTVNDACRDIVESPQEARPGYCKTTLSWWQGQGQLKVSVIYPLPWWGLQASGTYQNLSGAPAGVAGTGTALTTGTVSNSVPVQGNWTVSNALIKDSLRRDLSSGVNGNVTISIIPPYSMFEDRLSQLDVRLAKTIRLGRGRMQAFVDAYNVLNASTVLASSGNIGANFLTPTSILGPRIFKFGMQLDF